MGVHHHARLGEIPFAGAVQHTPVVPHHEVAGLPAVFEQRAAAGRPLEQIEQASDSSRGKPGMAWAWRPMNSDGRPVTGCTFNGRNCAGSSMP